MANSQLITYIQKQIKKGKDITAIKKNLLSVGWQEHDIEKVLAVIPASIVSQTFVLPKIRSLLKSSWKEFHTYYKTYWKIIFVAAVIMFPLGVFLYFLFNFLTALVIFGGVSFSLVQEFWLYLLYILFFSFMGMLFFLGQTTVIYAVSHTPEKIRIGATFGFAIRKALANIWLFFIGSLFITIGLIFFVIPGILLFVLFSFSLFVLAKENVGGVEALLRSEQYIKGLTLQILERLIVFYLPITLIFGVLGFCIYRSFSLENGTLLVISLGIFGIMMALILCFSPLLWIYPYLLYEHIVSLKEKTPITRTAIIRLRFLTMFVVILSLVPFIVLYQVIAHSNRGSIDTPPVIPTPTIPPLPSLVPVDASDSADEFLQFACKKSPAFTEDTCNGYRLMLPGYEGVCYSYKDCVDAYHQAETNPQPLISSDSGTIATPSAQQ